MTYLMNINTGTVQTSAEWADDGFNAENADLVEVVKDDNGDWIEA